MILGTCSFQNSFKGNIVSIAFLNDIQINKILCLKQIVDYLVPEIASVYEASNTL